MAFLLSRSAFVSLNAISSSLFCPGSSNLASKSLSRTVLNMSSSSGPAKQYLLHYSYIPEVLEKRGPYREGHLGLAKDFAAKGKCLFGGPSGDVGVEVPKGALFVFTDEQSAKDYANNDPYVANGIVTDWHVEEWTVAIDHTNL